MRGNGEYCEKFLMAHFSFDYLHLFFNTLGHVTSIVIPTVSIKQRHGHFCQAENTGWELHNDPYRMRVQGSATSRDSRERYYLIKIITTSLGLIFISYDAESPFRIRYTDDPWCQSNVVEASAGGGISNNLCTTDSNYRSEFSLGNRYGLTSIQPYSTSSGTCMSKDLTEIPFLTIIATPLYGFLRFSSKHVHCYMPLNLIDFITSKIIKIF